MVPVLGSGFGGWAVLSAGIGLGYVMFFSFICFDCCADCGRCVEEA